MTSRVERTRGLLKAAQRLCALLAGAPLLIPSALVGAAVSAADSDTAPRPPVSTVPATPDQADSAAGAIEEVTVTAERLNLIGTASTASQGVVVREELELLPDFRPGQLLETVPGLSVTSHSGEGKANQYEMRGYNLDHGTDLAVWVDAMPVNEPTHAHGQGYADINFMIPELATNLAFTKGPYYATEGDFSSVGAVHLSYLDRIEPLAQLTVGTLGFQRLFAAGSAGLGSHNLLGALELAHYDGPWTNPDDQRKVNAVVRLSDGTSQQGYSLTAMLYHNLWNSTTDQPARAIQQGLISRWGSLDPSDGGEAQRLSLSGQYHSHLGEGVLAASAYAISNRLTLWNNFTHELVDPVNGDQEAQHESRSTFGGELTYQHPANFVGMRNDVLAGLQVRTDFNDVWRLPTAQRVLLTPAQLAAVDYPSNFSEIDTVRLISVAAYVLATTYWTEWLRSVVGFRHDYLQGEDSGTNFGTASDHLPQPKVSLIFTPLDTTELYLSWGRAFHSDDLRGVNQARQQGIAGAPLIASQTGAELGVRQQVGTHLALTLALYDLTAESETTYDPDVGQDSAGPGSHRHGMEINVTYQPLRWLEVYGSYSANHARYDTDYDDGTGHVGRYLPNAPTETGSLNVYLKHLGPWYGGLQYRYVSGFPLSSDNVVQGRGYGEWNADLHYALESGWSFGLSLFNLMNKHADAAEFWYIDRLAGEPPEGVADVHLHPLEPFNARLTLEKSF